MRTFRSWALVALVALCAAPIGAQQLDITARGSGPYVVYVAGVEYSRHTTEREAVENASEALSDAPTASVYYVHEYTVDVALVGPAPSDTVFLPCACDSIPTPPDTTTPPPPPPPSDADLVLTWADGDLTAGGAFAPYTDGFAVRSGGPFTTSNHIEVMNTGNSGWTDGIIGYIDEPQVGQTVSATWEMTWDPATSGHTTHGFYFDNDIGGVNWGPPTIGLSIEDSVDRWHFGLWVSSAASPDVGAMRTRDRYPLVKGHPYEVELSYTRVGSNTYTAGFEVRELNGTVLYDSGDFSDHEWYSGNRTLENTTFTQSGAGAQYVTGFRVGNNGLDNAGGVTTITRFANVRLAVR